MVGTGIVAAALLFMSLLSGFLYFRYSRLKRAADRRKSLLLRHGVLVEVAPHEKERIREYARDNAATIALLLNTAYYSCDNFGKHDSRISEQFASLYANGGLQGLAENIVTLANMAENGAFYRLAADFALTELELRTCCFIYFGFRWQEICTADSLSENAYSVRCSRIRKKLGMAKEDKIPSFLDEYCRKFEEGASSSGQL